MSASVICSGGPKVGPTGAPKGEPDQQPQPQEMISPDLDSARAVALAERLYGVSGGTIKQLDGYDDKNFWIQPTAVQGNPHLVTLAPFGYTLKVMNNVDSNDTPFVEAQNQLLTFLSDNGVRCPRPAKNKDGRTYSLERCVEGGPLHAVRMLEFVSGDILGKVRWQPSLALAAGKELARLDSLMEKISLPALENRKTIWSLWEAHRVLQYLDAVPETSRKELVKEILDTFVSEIKKHATVLEADAALIHGDYNEFNIVVEKEDSGDGYRVVGVLDFGDCHSAPRLFEVALAAAYMALPTGDLAAVGDVLAGYCSARQFVGKALLKVCICARLCQSLVMGLRAHQMDPTNTYVLASQARGWKLLQDLWSCPQGSLERQWDEAVSSGGSEAARRRS